MPDADGNTDRSTPAILRFQNGHNCAQAVLTEFSGQLGMDPATAMKIASGFGGGMGRMGEMCGAVTGAIMVLGLKYGQTRSDDKVAKERAHALVREFAGKFEKQHGFLVCRELLGCDISRPEGFKLAVEKNLFHTVCPKYVAGAVRILTQMFEA